MTKTATKPAVPCPDWCTDETGHEFVYGARVHHFEPRGGESSAWIQQVEWLRDGPDRFDVPGIALRPDLCGDCAITDLVEAVQLVADAAACATELVRLRGASPTEYDAIEKVLASS